MSIAYIFQSNLIVGDHEGYCSGGECEDETSEDYYAFIIKIDDNLLADDNLFFDQFFFERCSEHFNTQFKDFEGSVGCGGSGYCGSSDSGLHHAFRLNLTLNRILRPDQVQIFKYITLIDENNTNVIWNRIVKHVIDTLTNDTQMLIEDWLR
jgi:hypothetical protein